MLIKQTVLQEIVLLLYEFHKSTSELYIIKRKEEPHV